MTPLELAHRMAWRADNVAAHRREIDGSPDGVFAQYEDELRNVAELLLLLHEIIKVPGIADHIDEAADRRDSGGASVETQTEGLRMDDAQKQKAAIAVGNRVRLRDGREGNVTEVRGNQIVVNTGEGGTIEAPASEAEAIDQGGEADAGKASA